MHFTLRKKFTLVTLFFLLCSFLCVSVITSHLMLNSVIKEKAAACYREGIHMANQYVGNYFEESENRKTLTTVKSHLSSLDIYLNADIWLISTNGEIIIDSSDTDIPEEYKKIEGFTPVLSSGTYYVSGDFFGMFEEEMLSVLVPISHDYHVRGYIAIHTPMSEIVAEKENYLFSSYAALVSFIALAVLLSIAHWLIVYRPVRRLFLMAGTYASGNYDQPLLIDRDDELGAIAHTMDFMAQSLKDSEDDQRKMISNISHDFRSPLTSIKGYIEAMLDGTIPVELQEKYLNIVLRETERLTKLTSSLLALNSMDPKQNRLDKTEFDINTVIKNTAASFEGTCTAKHITIDLLFSDWSSMVYADMGKIQQVLYNLIDNAIKFSPQDSVITIETTEKYEKVFVSVRDTGIGIPKSSLKKIWERFYKTDQSRGKDKKGTGLGLAIVREIIQLHDENINVISTEGVGTEFTFSLSKPKKEDGE